MRGSVPASIAPFVVAMPSFAAVLLLASLYAGVCEADRIFVPSAPDLPTEEDPRLLPHPWMRSRARQKRVLQFEDGAVVTMLTVAARPLLFHLSNFLSAREVEVIRASTPEKGFANKSNWGRISKLPKFHRTSKAQTVHPAKIKTLQPMLRRLADLTGLPHAWVNQTAMTAHRFKTGEGSPARVDALHREQHPLCLQSFEEHGRPLDEVNGTQHCPRFISVYYFLTTHEEADGDICFFHADDKIILRMKPHEVERLTTDDDFIPGGGKRCSEARHFSNAIFIAPKAGDALLWYNYEPPSADAPEPLGILDRCGGVQEEPVRWKTYKYVAQQWLTVPWWPDEEEEAVAATPVVEAKKEEL